MVICGPSDENIGQLSYSIGIHNLGRWKGGLPCNKGDKVIDCTRPAIFFDWLEAEASGPFRV